MNKNILILTGGTGGHVLPAVNFGDYLNKNSYICNLVTDERGFQYIKNYNGKVFKIKASHLSGNIFYNLFGIFKLLLGFIQSFIILIKLKPTIVISFGSYASLPPCFALMILYKILNIRFYIHEQNSIIGRSNKLFLRFANKIFVNFEKKYDVNKSYENKIKVVGLPNNFFKQRKNLNNYKKNDLITVFVYGGSQGSLPLLKMFENLLNLINPDLLNKLQFTIQCPKKYDKIISTKLIKLKCNFLIKSYYYEIENILLQTDFIISRAGAGTINDIIRYKIPSILMPLSNAKDNHQFENALILSNKKCAKIIDEKNQELNKIKLYFEEVLSNKTEQKKIINNFNQIFLPNTNKLMLNEFLND